jgi:hypothetical protein
MNKNVTTIEALAEMIQRTMASKEDINAVENRHTTRLDRIEHLLLEEQRRKIENLETRMKNSKTPRPFSRRFVIRAAMVTWRFFFPSPVSMRCALHITHKYSPQLQAVSCMNIIMIFMKTIRLND